MLKIDPLALYSVPFFARIAGVHPITIYQSLSGLKKFSVPDAVKLGRSVRFRGEAIIGWLDALPAYEATPPAVGQGPQRGRPRKAVQMARKAAAQAVEGGGAA